jgi:hypothetical protein
MITREEQESFELAARPLIRWINNNMNPHHQIVVDHTGAELLSGEAMFYTPEYLKD